MAAEFSTGSIGNWLTFAPRRVRVFLSKMLAAALAIVPVAAVAVGLVLGGSWLFYRHFDTLEAAAVETDLSSPVHVALRIVALAPVVALIGAGLGFLVRHTAAVLGTLLGWLVLVEAILANQVQSLRPWTLTTNVSAWVEGGTEYFISECTTSATGQSCAYAPHFLSQTHAAVYLGPSHSSSPSRRSWSSAAATSADLGGTPAGSVPTIRGGRRVRQSARGGGPGACR